MEETREISDAFTEFRKVVSITITLVFGGWIVRSLLGFDIPVHLTLLSLLLFSISPAMSAYDNWRYKKVILTSDGLLIGKRFFFLEEFIFVPFEEIESVSEDRLLKIYTGDLVIDLKNETEFGRRVIFKPIPAKWPFTPVRDEISQLAAHSEQKFKFDSGEKARLFE